MIIGFFIIYVYALTKDAVLTRYINKFFMHSVGSRAADICRSHKNMKCFQPTKVDLYAVLQQLENLKTPPPFYI